LETGWPSCLYVQQLVTFNTVNTTYPLLTTTTTVQQPGPRLRHDWFDGLTDDGFTTRRLPFYDDLRRTLVQHSRGYFGTTLPSTTTTVDLQRLPTYNGNYSTTWRTPLRRYTVGLLRSGWHSHLLQTGICAVTQSFHTITNWVHQAWQGQAHGHHSIRGSTSTHQAVSLANTFLILRHSLLTYFPFPLTGTGRGLTPP